MKKHQNIVKAYKDDLSQLFENEVMNVFEDMAVKPYSGEAKVDYDDLLARYDQLQMHEFLTLENLIYDTDRLVSEWHFRLANRGEQDIETLLNQTVSKMDELNADIETFLEMDEQNEVRFNDLSKRYREARKTILAKSYAFHSATDALENELKDLEGLLHKSREYREKADAVSEKQSLQTISERLVQLETAVEKLPHYSETIDKNYLADVLDIEKTYTEMINTGFVFEQEGIADDISQLKDRIQATDNAFKNLDINQLEDDMSAIDKGIDKVLAALAKEYQAQKNFSRYHKQLEAILQFLYKQNRQIKIETDRYGQMFHLDDFVLSYGAKKEGDIHLLEGKHDNLRLKVHENSLAYSKANEQAKKLIKQSQKIYQEQATFLNELYSLEDDIKKYKVELLSVIKELREMNTLLERSGLPARTDSFKELYNYTVDNTQSLKDELDSVRINVTAMDHYVDNVKQAMPDLRQSYHDMVAYASLTEELLRVLQQYEQDNTTIKNEIDQINYYYQTVNEYAQAYQLAYNLLEAIDSEQASHYPLPGQLTQDN